MSTLHLAVSNFWMMSSSFPFLGSLSHSMAASVEWMQWCFRCNVHPQLKNMI